MWMFFFAGCLTTRHTSIGVEKWSALLIKNASRLVCTQNFDFFLPCFLTCYQELWVSSLSVALGVLSMAFCLRSVYRCVWINRSFIWLSKDFFLVIVRLPKRAKFDLGFFPECVNWKNWIDQWGSRLIIENGNWTKMRTVKSFVFQFANFSANWMSKGQNRYMICLYNKKRTK